MSTFCAAFDTHRCRSCEWLELSYDEQLRKKEERVRRELGFLGDFTLDPSVGSEPQAFRARVKMSVTGTLEKPVIGLLGEDALDEGRELLDCPIHHPELNALLSALPEFIREHRLTPYRIAERTGELKGLIAFRSPGSGEMYLRFVLRSKDGVARIKKGLPFLQSRFPSLTVVSANLQPIPHAILEGKEEIVLTANTTIEHRLGRFSLRLSPQAFVQTNPDVAHRLYQRAAELVGQSGARSLVELYCGQGAFSFYAAERIATGLGIELNADAVRTANETAGRLGFSHLRFEAADAASVTRLLRQAAPDIVLVNPPRSGLRGAAEMIVAQSPQHLIYSSCEITTLAHDLRKFLPEYRVRRVGIFDLFPHTEHFESLVWMERASSAHPPPNH